MSELYEPLSSLFNAAAFVNFQDGIVTKIEEFELTYSNSIQKVVSLNLIREQSLQIVFTAETIEVGKEPRYIVSMQFVEDGIYVDVVDNALFVTFTHLIQEVYDFIEPMIDEMNHLLQKRGTKLKVDTTYLETKIERFKNVTDEKKEQIYSLYNILFI